MKKVRHKTDVKVLIILAFLYFCLNIVSFFVEAVIAGMQYDMALFLRITTLILDVTFIVTGLLTGFQVLARKKLRRNKFFAKKPRLITYVADTISILIFFFSLYYVRIELLFQLDRITHKSFVIGFWISFITALFFGALLKSIIKKIKKRLHNMKWKAVLKLQYGFFLFKKISCTFSNFFSIKNFVLIQSKPFS